MSCLNTFLGCGWAYGFTFTPLPPQRFPQTCEMAEILPDESVQTMPLCFCWAFKTFQTASHVHVIHIWGVWAPSQVVDGHIWLHFHTTTTTDVSPDLWELAEIRTDASMQTMPLLLIEALEPFKLHPVSVRLFWAVSAPSQATNGHIASHSYWYLHWCFPRFVRAGWDPTWCKWANHATKI